MEYFIVLALVGYIAWMHYEKYQFAQMRKSMKKAPNTDDNRYEEQPPDGIN